MVTVKPLHVLILLALAALVLTLNQKFATGQSVYPLPPPSSQLSIVNYPEKVKESLKNVIGITADIYPKNNNLTTIFGYGQKTAGTGLMFEPGIFISARHILMSGINSFGRLAGTLLFDRHGIPSSSNLNYSIIGTTDVGRKTRDIKLNLVGMGTVYKFEDYMVLRSYNYPPELKPIERDEKMLDIDKVIYNAGYVHTFEYLETDPSYSPVLFDIIRTSYTGSVDAIIKDLPVNKLGVSFLYRIKIKFEQGFSGGPILNSEGKLVAITVWGSYNYLYAIPIKDIRLFIEKLKKDDIIK